MLVAQRLGGVGRKGGRLEALADFGHDDQTQKIVIAAADVGRFFAEVERLYILAQVRQFGTYQADGPRDLCPQQEHRDGSEASVDGIVARNPYLAADIDVLKSLKSGSGDDAGDDGMFQLYFGVGDEYIQPDEHAPY